MDTPQGTGRPRGKPFEVGNQYGKGRPPGSRNKATIALQELLEGEGEDLLRKLIELAKAGNDRALRLCVERLLPPVRERSIQLALRSEISTAADLSRASADILRAVADGEITPSEAVQLSEIIEVRRKSIASEEFDRRLTELEKKVKEEKIKNLED